MAGRAIRRSTTVDRRSASRWIAVAIAAVTALVLTTGAAAGAQSINSCQTLSTSDTYVLSGSLNAGGGDCLTVAADGVTIDGNGYAITNAATAVDNTAGHSGLALENVDVDSSTTALDAQGSDGLTVAGSALNSTGTTLYLRGISGTVDITGSTLAAGGSDAIDIDDSTGVDITISGSVFDDADDIVYADGTSSSPAIADSTLLIENNRLLASSNVLDWYELENVDLTFRSNIASGITSEGFLLDYIRNGSLVFRGNDLTIDDYGFEPDDLPNTDFRLIDNQMDVTYDGIYGDTYSNAVFHVVGNRINSSSGWGMDIGNFHPNTELVISDNDIDSDDDAIDLGDVENSTVTIERNDINSVDDYGIYLDDLEPNVTVSVADNVVTAYYDAFYLYGLENGTAQIRNNDLNSTTDVGMDLDELNPNASATVTGNVVVAYDEALVFEELEHNSSGRIANNELVSTDDYGMDIDDVGPDSTLDVVGNDVTSYYEALYFYDLYENSTATIRGNTFNSTDYEAADVNDLNHGGSPLLDIGGNVFEAGTGEDGVKFYDIEAGNLTFRRNDVQGDDDAVTLDSGSHPERLEVESNVFAAPAFGVDNGNTTAGAIVDARNNYWNASDGPNSTGPLQDPVTGALANGTGSDVSAGPTAGVSNVRFDPFLGTNPLEGGGAANEVPIAAFDVTPAEPRAGDTLTFNASGSSDPDGEIVSYFWEIVGPNGVTVGSGVETTRAVATEGRLEVSLIVTDDEGDSSSTDRTVSVAAAEEVAEEQVQLIQNETEETQTPGQTGETETGDDSTAGTADDQPDDTEEVGSPGDGEGGTPGDDGGDGEGGSDGGSGTAPVVLGVIAVVGILAAAVLFLRG